MTPATTGRLAPVSLATLPPYAPTTYVDFAQPEHRVAFEAALAEVKSQLGRAYPLVIGGEKIDGEEKPFESTNPARPSEVIGRFASASRAQAERAVEVAHEAFRTWSRVPAAERAAYLVEAARRMRERRHVFSAWMVLEVGKTWAEADADTAEAIDFLEFYAREMLRYGAAGAADAAARRARHAGLHPARRRRGHPAVELPAGDLRRHDDARRSSPATRWS